VRSDIEVRDADGDMVQVELRGVDVYDPTTGAVRSKSPKEIALWLIDTNYNEEAFFVRPSTGKIAVRSSTTTATRS
jgi:adenine-specific DNA-methyltransferase